MPQSRPFFCFVILIQQQITLHVAICDLARELDTGIII